MVEVAIKPEKLQEDAATVKKIISSVKSCSSRVGQVSRGLSGMKGGSYYIVAGNLNQIVTRLGEMESSANALKQALEGVAEEYSSTEKNIVRTMTKIFVQYEAAGDVFNASANATVEGNWWNRKASASAEASVADGSFGLNVEDGLYTLSGSGAVLGAGAAAEAGYTVSPFDIGAYASAEANAYALKGELTQEGLWGLEQFKASGEVLSASASAKAEAKLVDNGNFAPSLKAEVSASGAVAKGEAEGRIGTDNYNVNVSAEGSVLSAEANAEVGVGIVGDDGEIGVTAEAGAGAYLAEGEVKGGFTIAGIEVSTSIGGNIGVGAEAGFSATSDKIKINAGLSALLGVEGELEIDWSGFEWPDFGW